MSAERTCALLLRLYPPQWRARYGAELEGLILETNGGEVPWRVRLDVGFAAGRARLRSAGLGGDPLPDERMRGGTLLVLCAWALLVVGGMLVQKFSEHWQAATPAGSRELPRAAFDALLVSAWIGSALVVAGAAAAMPSLVRFVRAGGWAHVRRPVQVACALTLAAVPASVAVVLWGSTLTVAERNGHDTAYAAVAGLWALLLVAVLAAWTKAGVAAARRLAFSPPMLRVEAALAVAVSVAMAVGTAATVVWWASIARSAPWFLDGAPAGSSGSPLALQLVVAASLMLLATLAGAAGARQALRGLAAGGARRPE